MRALEQTIFGGKPSYQSGGESNKDGPIKRTSTAKLTFQFKNRTANNRERNKKKGRGRGEKKRGKGTRVCGSRVENQLGQVIVNGFGTWSLLMVMLVTRLKNERQSGLVWGFPRGKRKGERVGLRSLGPEEVTGGSRDEVKKKKNVRGGMCLNSASCLVRYIHKFHLKFVMVPEEGGERRESSSWQEGGGTARILQKPQKKLNNPDRRHGTSPFQKNFATTGSDCLNLERRLKKL